MFPTSAKHVDRFEHDGIVYRIATPTLLTRAAYRRAVSALGAVYHHDDALLDAVRDGVKECVADDQQVELLELIDDYVFQRDQLMGLGDEASDEDREAFEEVSEQLNQIESFMTREYPRYSEMVADRSHWLAVAPIVAFRHFVVGWEGGEVAFKRRGGLVDESVMEQLSPEHIEAVGWRVINLMSPDRGQEKNSEPQSQSPTAQETSTADATPPTAETAGK